MVLRDEEMVEQIQETIIAYKAKHPYLPTVRELADQMGISSTGHMHYLLKRCPGVKQVKIGPSERSVRWDVE